MKFALFAFGTIIGSCCALISACVAAKAVFDGNGDKMCLASLGFGFAVFALVNLWRGLIGGE